MGLVIVMDADDPAADIRGINAPMARLLVRRETRANPVGIVCPEMNLVGNATSAW